MNHAIDLVSSALLLLAGLVMQVIGVCDTYLSGLMTQSGMPRALQPIVLIVVAVMLLVFAIRLLGRLFGALILVLLVLLMLHRGRPELVAPNLPSPPAHNQGDVQI